MKRPPGVVVLILLFSPLAASCSDETTNDVQQEIDEAREDVEDAAGTAAARTVAEGLRAALLAKDLGPDESLRSVNVLQTVADDLPGDPEVTGIADTDGDGKDDDGKIGVAVGDQVACLTVQDNGETDISTEPC